MENWGCEQPCSKQNGTGKWRTWALQKTFGLQDSKKLTQFFKVCFPSLIPQRWVWQNWDYNHKTMKWSLRGAGRVASSTRYIWLTHTEVIPRVKAQEWNTTHPLVVPLPNTHMLHKYIPSSKLCLCIGPVCTYSNYLGINKSIRLTGIWKCSPQTGSGRSILQSSWCHGAIWWILTS